MKRHLLYFAWLIATLGTLGSLYFSEIRHIEPCHLCWLQRICLYPLVILLGIGTCRADFSIAIYTLPQALIGTCIAAYQVAIQQIPGWEPINLCGAGPSCAEKIAIGLGPITIPMLSLLAYLTIVILLFCSLPLANKEKIS